MTANRATRTQSLRSSLREVSRELETFAQRHRSGQHGAIFGTSSSSLTVSGSAYPRNIATRASATKARNTYLPETTNRQAQRQHTTSTSEQQSSFENEISNLRAEVSRLRRQNESLREKEHRLHEAEIKAEMYQKQVEELKNLPPRLFASRIASPEKKKVRISDQATTSTPVLRQSQRNDALNDRLRELQKENIDLRSRLAGVTPKNVVATANIEKCAGCRDLNRQKTHQATYFEEKVVAARQRAVEYQQHCNQLRTEMTELKAMLSDLQSKYQKQIDQLSEHASMYKSRSERLERWNCSSLRGFQTDIKHIREKLSAIEREIVQTQLLCAANE